MTIKCDTPTYKGRQCRIPVDIRLHPTTCHVHMPNGNFQKKLRAGEVIPRKIQPILSDDEKDIIRYWKDILR